MDQIVKAHMGLEAVGLASWLFAKWPSVHDGGGFGAGMLPYMWPDVLTRLEALGIPLRRIIRHLVAFDRLGMIWVVQRGGEILQLEWRRDLD
jgi:hypothetical protein